MKPSTKPAKTGLYSDNVAQFLSLESFNIFNQVSQWNHSNWFSHDLNSFIDQIQCRHDTLTAHCDQDAESSNGRNI